MTEARPESSQSGHEYPPVDHGHDRDRSDVHDEGSGHGHGPGGDHDHQHAAGIKGFVLSLFRPHSHDAADSVDSALEASTEGIRAVKISLIALGATAIAQLIVVLITGSVALLADTIHNFSDALTAIPLWIAFLLSRRSKNRRYTYGYGRAEDLAGVFIVVMIALSSILAAYESIHRLIDPQPITHAWVVVAAGLIGFAGNELVAVYRIRVGTKIGSAALVADGLHARTDGFTSLAVVVGAIGVMAGFPLADPIVGLLITVAILAVLRGAARDIYRRLMDAVDPDMVDAADAAVRDVPGVRSVDSVQLRWIGHRMHAEITLTVDDTLSVVKAHAIADEAQHQLIHRVPRLDAATVHVNPAALPGVDHHAATGHHRTPTRVPAETDPEPTQISGSLRFHWLTAPSMVDEVLQAQLLSCWRDVSNAGGAAGFPFLPVSTEQVRAAIEGLIESLDPSLNRILVAMVDQRLAGWLVLAGNADTLTAHWARVLRVQTALEHRGIGVGGALMREVERAARDDLQLRHLHLELRAGMGLERFYESCGWRQIGRWPEALCLGGNELRDEVLMHLPLR